MLKNGYLGSEWLILAIVCFILGAIAESMISKFVCIVGGLTAGYIFLLRNRPNSIGDENKQENK